jgi:hypothetical protein
MITASFGSDLSRVRSSPSRARRFDPAPDHQFCNVISSSGQLRGANWEALTTRSRTHRPPRDALLLVTRAAGLAMNILSGQRVDLTLFGEEAFRPTPETKVTRIAPVPAHHLRASVVARPGLPSAYQMRLNSPVPDDPDALGRSALTTAPSWTLASVSQSPGERLIPGHRKIQGARVYPVPGGELDHARVGIVARHIAHHVLRVFLSTRRDSRSCSAEARRDCRSCRHAAAAFAARWRCTGVRLGRWLNRNGPNPPACTTAWCPPPRLV